MKTFGREIPDIVSNTTGSELQAEHSTKMAHETTREALDSGNEGHHKEAAEKHREAFRAHIKAACDGEYSTTRIKIMPVMVGHHEEMENSSSW